MIYILGYGQFGRALTEDVRFTSHPQPIALIHECTQSQEIGFFNLFDRETVASKRRRLMFGTLKALHTVKIKVVEHSQAEKDRFPLDHRRHQLTAVNDTVETPPTFFRAGSGLLRRLTARVATSR